MEEYRSVSRRSLIKGIGGSGIIGAVGTASGSDRTGADDREVYIVLGGGSGLRSRLSRAGFEVRHELADGAVFIVQGPKAKRDELRSMAAVTDAVTNETYVFDDIEQSEGEVVRRDEPLSDKQWDKRLIRADAAHDRATGDGTTIAIIDSGVSFNHPDLASRIDADRSRFVRNAHVHAGTGEVRTATNSGLVLKPTERVTRPVAADVDGHGSHVAGIAAAPRNGSGIVGMAPDASIVSLRTMFFDPVYSYGGTTYSQLIGTLADILIAIDYAVDLGVDVVNASIRGIRPNNSRAFAAVRRVVQHAMQQGVVVVAAAGNRGVNVDRESDYVLPAETPGTVTVAATGPTDKRSSYSNYGNGTVDVAAPGGGYETRAKTRTTDPDAVAYPYPTNYVLSTVPKSIYGKRYLYKPGTSMAAPQVAGLACLLRELAPDLHPRRVRQAITQGAVELSGDNTDGLGAGRIDAPAAIERISDRL
ncbi:peptidase S8/S53 subtilisin kexin sedolisin [Natrinema sp. CBA1119]|uniref:S8 family serine peptidase n=1 Tax=Natrinema sp. CBA1119 TaxID=1608465 RepID=UPI000BF60226|nr:S8 family serine peptidase [Natrinema sp. CBA1119]PGF17393.1 peptidase S8/S53 subtilisin kexin sedolisin [Natrinema sp. CBA1119]